MDQNPTRITKLDGLRGLLSLIVVLNHSFLVVAIPSYANVWQQNLFQFHDWQSKLQQIFMILGNGGAAVTLFFIMSGLLLGQSFKKISYTVSGLLGYYLKRLVRLYPVYLALLFFTFIYMNSGFVHQTYEAASSWFNWWMRFDMTPYELFLNILFVHIYIGGVTWTLRVILVVSILFPLIYQISKRTTWWQDVIIAFALIYLSFHLFAIPDFRDFRYLYMFYAGISLPKFKTFFEKINSRQVISLLPLILYLVFIFRYQTDEYLGGVGESLACWFLVGTISYSGTKFFNFLEDKVLKFFGQISYSLYLIHFTVLYILASTMFHYFKFEFTRYYFLSHLVLLFSSLVLSIFLSVYVYRYVEKGAIQLFEKINHKN